MDDFSVVVLYKRFASNQSSRRFYKQKVKGLLHERGFVMEEVEEKIPAFYAILHDMQWGTLVEEPFKCNEAIV